VFDMEKVDRAELYGNKSLEVVDENGGRCRMVTLASDGHGLIGKGGTRRSVFISPLLA